MTTEEHMDRVELANRALALADRPTTYVEIGVLYGASFRSVTATTKIAVDPDLRSRRMRLTALGSRGTAHVPLRMRQYAFLTTSDEFFRRHSRLLHRFPPDVVLVDGLHTADQAHRDIVHSVEALGPRGLVLVHDCNPQTRTAALPTHDEFRAVDRAQRGWAWNGEVWKAIVRLRSERDDLVVSVLDCDEGLGLVWRGEPRSKLDLSAADVDALTYADLAEDRAGLLGLRTESDAMGLVHEALGGAT